MQRRNTAISQVCCIDYGFWKTQTAVTWRPKDYSTGTEFFSFSFDSYMALHATIVSSLIIFNGQEYASSLPIKSFTASLPDHTAADTNLDSSTEAGRQA